MVVIEELNFNVFGFVEEMFNEDGVVFEGVFCFGGGFFEGFFEGSFFMYNMYIMIIIVISSFDDDGEVIFVCESFDFFKFFDGVFGVWDDWYVCSNGNFFG